MCKFTSANCGKHTALHGKPNTFTGNSENCRFTDASWCCNNAHKQALQWFWCFCLMLLSKSCACMLQHTIEADCGQHTALHGKPNTFTETLGHCRCAEVSWCCNSAHKQALQWFWCFCLMLLSKSCACMLQHTIEADCGQHTALHGKPNTFTGNSENCRFADASWCCNSAHKQALQ